MTNRVGLLNQHPDSRVTAITNQLIVTGMFKTKGDEEESKRGLKYIEIIFSFPSIETQD